MLKVAFMKFKKESFLTLSWLPLIVLLLGFLSGVGFWWLNQLNYHYEKFDSLIDDMYEIDRQVSLAHLWLDDPSNLETAQVRSLLDDATDSVNDVLKRLRSDNSLLHQHPKQHELLSGLYTIKELLAEMRSIVEELHHGANEKVLADIDRRIHMNFQVFSHAALRVEEIMKHDSSIHISASLSMFRTIFIGWVVFIVFLLVVLLWVESRRISIAQALFESEEKFRTMAESARDAIVLADSQGRISYCNHAAERMFGESLGEVVGREMCDILMPLAADKNEQGQCLSLWQRGLEGFIDTSVVEIQVSVGGESFPVEVSVAPINLDNQQQHIAILRDIRERKRAELALRENESFLRTLVNAMPDFVCFKDGNGRWLMANEFGLRLFGIENVDYQNKTDAELSCHNEFFKPAFLSCIQSDQVAWQVGKVSRSDEIIPRRVGDPYIFDVIKVPLFNDDQSRKGLLVIGRDITQRKKIEKALQDSEERLRHLSANLFVMQETERRRIANELHDELGQALVALKMQVRAIQRQLLDDRPKEGKECEEVCEYINQIIENVRRLSRDLSPVVLDDLGLGAAIKYMVDNFAGLHDIDGSVTIDEIDNLLGPNEERIVYRIVQEALTNIAKHAKARNVMVNIRKRNRWLYFLIRDDGCGFDPVVLARKESTRRGLGLTAMSERVRMLGGLFDIESKPGHGTSITMAVPIQGS